MAATDRSYCDTGDHDNCSGYTDDNPYSRPCWCRCHNGERLN